MKTKILILCVFALCALSSCFEDKGNYDLIDLNNAAITSFSKGNAIIGEPYIIKPVIDFKGESEDDFEFFWYANRDDHTTSDTLSYEKDLSFVFTKPGWYLGVFLIKNKKTGGITTQMFDFNVYTQYQSGWLVLSDVGGVSTLSFARTNSNKEIDKELPNIYETLYSPDKLGLAPIGLTVHHSSDADQILVIQDGGDGAVELSGTNFEKVITTDKEFVEGAYPSGFSPAFAQYGERIEVIVGKDGRALTRIRESAIFQSARYSSTPIADAKIMKTYQGAQMSYILMYDAQNNRIIGIQDTPQLFTGRILYAKMDVQGGGNQEGFTDLENMGSDSKVIYVSSYRSGAGIYNVHILKKGNSYKIQKFRLRVESVAESLYVIDGVELDFAGNGIVSDNTKYFLVNGSYLFFAEGNTLYYYDFAMNQVSTYATLSGNIADIESNTDRDQIAVGLDNGELHVFDVTNEVLASGVPVTLHKIENLGKIVDVQYK